MILKEQEITRKGEGTFKISFKYKKTSTETMEMFCAQMNKKKLHYIAFTLAISKFES